MIRGIGVDTASISELARILEVAGDAFISRTFSAREIAAAHARPDSTEYLAVRFAAKEAVIKAVGDLAPHTALEFRAIETLSAPTGAPYVQIDPELQAALDEAQVERLFLSATTEGDFATVFVIAEGK